MGIISFVKEKGKLEFYPKTYERVNLESAKRTAVARWANEI